MTGQDIPLDFLYNDTAAVKAKTTKFVEAGPDSLHLVLDFDRTLTTSRAEADATTWHILKEHLPQTGKDRYQELFNYYWSLESTGMMTPEHAVTWSSEVLDLFVKHKVNMRTVEEDFISKATIRPETKKLFDTCHRYGIPTIIMSAGIKDVIDVWGLAYGVKPTMTLSTSLQLDSDGIVRGWDRSSLIHALNKKEIDHPELMRIRSERPNAIVVGDSLTDADMAEGEKNVLRVYIHDLRPDEDQAAVAQKGLSRFDVMIKSGSLRAVKQLVDQIAASRQQSAS